MKRMATLLLIPLITLLLSLNVSAALDSELLFDAREGLDAVGADELPRALTQEARELMEETGVAEVTPESILHLSPGEFFGAIWNSAKDAMREPIRLLGVIVGISVLCALIGGLQSESWEKGLSEIFGLVAALCMVAAITAPLLESIVQTSGSIQGASNFMLSFIPVFSAALVASGQPITGSAYNIFLFSTCQVVAQVVAQTLIPLMCVYLALCIVGSFSKEIKIESAASTIKSIVSWILGFVLTIFIGILSVQTMVSGSADSMSVRTAKFFVGSFVPVVGGALSEALVAAQGCLRLIKTSVGAYGIIASLFLFLPTFLKVFLWYVVTNLGVVVGDVMGVPQVSSILKSCSTVLGILISVLLCYALLIIVSITVVMVTGMGSV